MISQRARDSFDHTVIAALKSAMGASADEPCKVEAIGDVEQINERKVVLLTLSTYLFRVMTLIYFTMDRATKQHFAAINKADAASMSESEFLDVIGECGNICCGTISRELSRHFPHLGMSTPNFLDRDCAGYLDQLKVGYVKHFKIEMAHALTLHASLCVCDFSDIDFAVDMAQAEEAKGELEMF